MPIFVRIRKTLGAFAGSAIALALVAYFGWSAINGDRGYFAMRDLDRRIEIAQVRHDAVKAERDRLERRAKLLHRGQIDDDMLDERARALLNRADKDEFVILVDPAKE